MKFAIQELLLPGDSPAEKFAHAQALGVDGVEVWSHDLSARLEDIATAAITTGVPVAAVHYHSALLPTILDQFPSPRETALQALRDAICCAADLGAAGIIFTPHHGTGGGYGLPDLSPWMTAWQMHMELFYTHMRSLEDYSMALGIKFFVQPVNRYEFPLLRRVEQAAKLVQRLNHTHVRVAVDTFHMALEETSINDAITAHANEIGYVYVADSNRRLPGQGLIDFAGVAAALRSIQYDGWVTLAGGTPGLKEYPSAGRSEIAASLAYLRERGW